MVAQPCRLVRVLLHRVLFVLALVRLHALAHAVRPRLEPGHRRHAALLDLLRVGGLRLRRARARRPDPGRLPRLRVVVVGLAAAGVARRGPLGVVLRRVLAVVDGAALAPRERGLDGVHGRGRLLRLAFRALRQRVLLGRRRRGGRHGPVRRGRRGLALLEALGRPLLLEALGGAVVALLLDVDGLLPLLGRLAAAPVEAQVVDALAAHGADAVVVRADLAVVGVLRHLLAADAAALDARREALRLAAHLQQRIPIRRRAAAVRAARDVARAVLPLVRHDHLGQLLLAVLADHGAGACDAVAVRGVFWSRASSALAWSSETGGAAAARGSRCGPGPRGAAGARARAVLFRRAASALA
mmetsp:Transcript_24778/g.74327  ORF Transcript_24778/g.74327 Transcript_24778/m.74327 type:complete len:357 (+) Transcript_24778:36-1106(+)